MGLVVLSATTVSCNDKNNGTGTEEPEAGATSAVVAATEYGSWSYYNLADSTQKTLDIQFKEGAVTGMYTGNSANNTYGISQDDVVVVISQLTTDSVTVDVYSLNMSMSGGESLVDLTASALATNNGTKWVLTSDEATSNLVDPDGDETYSDYKLQVTGEIGLTSGSEVNLTLSVTPGAMPFAIPLTYTATVENSYIYEVDGEGDFSWDIAFHKYDVRTNGASVAKVSATSLDAVTSIPADSEFTADVDSYVISDLSNMMSGSVGYHYTTTNEVLYDWVTRTATGSMPPTLYELNSGVVFVVKTNSGEYYKIKFTDHTSDLGEATYATFSYMKMDN